MKLIYTNKEKNFSDDIFKYCLDMALFGLFCKNNNGMYHEQVSKLEDWRK